MCSCDGAISPLFLKKEKMFDYYSESCYNTIDGDHREKVPPVLIPNTEVKLFIAKYTWLETTREIRTSPSYHERHRMRCLFCFNYKIQKQSNVLIPIVPCKIL